MARHRRTYIRDRRVALWLGVGAYVAGSLLLWDAYEHRGQHRPWGMKLLPGG